MKKLLIISVLLLVFTGLNVAQDATPSLVEKKREKREDMLLMNFNWSYLLNTSDSLKVKGYSWGYDLKIMYDVPIQNSNFSFAAGGGLGITNLYTNSEINHYNVGTDSAQSYFVPISDTRNVKRNKLTITYADIPFELRYRSNLDKRGYSWKVAAGVKVGYHLQTRSKMIEDSKKFKTYDYPNYEKWRYGLNVRVAYGRVGVNAFYSLTSIFDEGKGEVVNPISVGITLMPF